MSRPIIKTFTLQGTESRNIPAVLYSRNDPRWGSFMNSYAIWPNQGNAVGTYTIKRTFNAPYTGIYRFRSAVDNSATVKVDGATVGGTVNFNQTPSPVEVTLTSGEHLLEFVVSNAGDVAGFACTISQPPPGQPNPPPETVLWDTRTNAVVPADSVKSDYSFTVDFNGTVTAHIWGAGGGGGSADAGNHYGGLGADGLYNTKSFSVSKGDVVEVAIGQGGRAGQGGRPCTGGTGGLARTNINSQSSKSFNGGSGGSGPVSGAGGGGGGATAVLVNGELVLAAGGGGGGGGAGNNSHGKDASTENNAMLRGGSIKVQSTNYNVTRDTNAAWVSVNGTYVIYGATRGHTLAVFNPFTLALESKTTYDTYGSGNSNALTTGLNNVANGKIVIIFQWDASALSSGTRTLLNSQFGGTSTKTWGSSRISHIFIGVKNGSVPAIESTSLNSTISETYNVGTVTPTEYRGEDGQTRTSDGGTGGGGGGGYPGGDGGANASGDNGANAGISGGNFPVTSTNLRGSSSPYYRSDYGDGGGRTGNGRSGYAVLEITPDTPKAVVSAIKVSGTWRQVTAGYVKVSGTWQEIDTTYVKRNGEWRLITSSGDIGSLADPQATSTNIGRSQRTYT